MKILDKQELTLFENIVGVSQESLRSVLYKFLKQYYADVTYDDDFLIAQGTIPIALVAHMDTVFKSPAKEVFYDRKKNVMWSPTGLGADDRAGVFAIIQIIKHGYRPHVIFTTDEEIGCVGAGELSYLPCPFKDLRYIVQLDRRNSNDCVFYECDNPEFEKYIESFGFVTASGSFSDISELCPRWYVAGVNLSIGYRDEHSTSEILFVGQMLDTIKKVEMMLSDPKYPSFKYIPSKDSWYCYDWPNDDDFRYNDYPMPKNTISYKCCSCGKLCSEDDVLPVKLIRGGRGFMCEKCLMTKAEWCRECGEAFEVDPKHPSYVLCPDCRGGKHGC